MLTEYGLDQLAAEVHTIAYEKGFWDGDTTDETIGTKLALVHSEVTEVLEAVRKNQGEEAIVEEMADVIIRLLDLYARLRDLSIVNASLDDVVQLKVEKNRGRPYKHGNRF